MIDIFRKLSLLLCLYFWYFTGLTQDYQQSVFIELGGLAPDYSLNYEYVFDSERPMRLFLRAGGGISSTKLAAPLGIGFISSDAPHYFQFILGLVPFIRDYSEDNPDTFVDLAAGVGYRFQQKDARWFVMANMYPKMRLDPTERELSEGDPQFKFSIGIAGGWRF